MSVTGVLAFDGPIDTLERVSVPDEAETSEGNAVVEGSCERRKLMLLIVRSLPPTMKTAVPSVSGETCFESWAVDVIVMVPRVKEVEMISASCGLPGERVRVVWVREVCSAFVYPLAMETQGRSSHPHVL